MKTAIRMRKVLDPFFNLWWNFQCRDSYWRLRNSVRLGDFYTRRWFFNARLRIEQTQTTALDSWGIVRKALGSLAWALVLFFILSCAEPLMRRLFPGVHFLLVEFTDAFLDLVGSKPNMREESYSNFLGGVASVGGVFLGLYFTAVSIGVGQQIGTLSPRLRRLIVTERKGSFYIRLLTTLTALSFLLWANAAALNNFSYPAIVFVAGFGLLVITAFYPLGLQSFFLAEPSSIAIPVFQSIHVTLKRIRRNPGQSIHPSFDSFYRRQTVENLHTLEEIGALALSPQRIDRQQLSNVLGNLYNQVIYYLEFKHAIESTSQWYSRNRVHDDYLMVDDVKGSLLEQFGHIPMPEEQPNPDWLEHEVLSFTEVILKEFSLRKDIDGLTQIIVTIRNYVAALSRRWELDSALAVYDVIKKHAEPICSDSTLSFLSRLGLVDAISGTQIDIIQQCLQQVVGENANDAIERLTDLVFGLPVDKRILILPKVKGQIENLVVKIAIEKKVEGKQFTPRWYVSQIIAQSYAEQVIELYTKLITIPLTPAKDKKTLTADEASILAMHLQRVIEAVSRLKGQVVNYGSFAKELKKYEKIPDLVIPILDEKPSVVILEEILDKSFDLLGDLILPVFKDRRDKKLPDFFGLAYSQLIKELFMQISSNEFARFSKLYIKVLTAAFAARERLDGEYSHVQDVIQRTAVAHKPVMDLMVLGAHAAIYSEIHSNVSLKETVIEAWKVVLATFKLDQAWLKSVYILIDSDFRMRNFSQDRFAWQRELERKLRELKFLKEDQFSSHRPSEVVVPGGPLLRALCREGHGPTEDFCEIFSAVYLPLLGTTPEEMKKINSQFYRRLKEKLSGGSNETP